MLGGKGMQVIDLYQLPKEIEEYAKTVSLSDELGRKTYAVLELVGSQGK